MTREVAWFGPDYKNFSGVPNRASLKTNFVSSNPNMCTILGYMVNKEVMFGIVYNPILDQLWTAKKGIGAEHNGKKVSLSF